MKNFTKFNKFKQIFSSQLNKFPKFNFANQPQANSKKSNPPKNTEEVELKPEPFIPFEQMSDKQIRVLSEKNIKTTYYYYGNHSQRNAEKKYNVMEFYSKKLRRDYIRNGEFSSNKHVIKVKRLRKNEDTIERLDKNKECAALIQGREEFPDIDVVIDRNLLVKLKE